MRRAIQRGWQRPGWVNRLLYPVSLLYAAAMAARRLAYRRGVFRRHKLPVPLVVVGNLCVGGTGKTPLVMELVEAMKSRGMTPGVIARGYRARPGRWPRAAGTGGADAAQVGDEAALIARRCRVPVMVGPDRRQSAEALLGRHRCDILVSDDGFQHLQLHRDLDIVVIDARRRFGNAWCLPAGPLREPPAALKRAGIVVANDSGGDTDARPGEFRMAARIDRAVYLGGTPRSDAAPRQRALRDFAGRPVHAVAGIGHPARFFRQLRALGLDVAAHPRPDHHRFTARDFAFATASDTVLMTEKDAVKCEELVAGGQLAGQYWAVPLRVSPGPGLMDAVFRCLATAAAR